MAYYLEGWFRGEQRFARGILECPKGSMHTSLYNQSYINRGLVGQPGLKTPKLGDFRFQSFAGYWGFGNIVDRRKSFLMG